MPISVIGIVVLAFSLAATPSLAAKQDQAIDDDEVAGLFASTCGFCHQDGGRVAGKGPQLMGTQRSDAFIINRIKHGKEGYMPAFGQALTAGQIKSIVHYIRNLKPE
ncbi:MAG: c-type cytochrome [Stellaceae bacterium]